jgi:hypothetical protein
MDSSDMATRKYDINDLKKFARKKGGDCLSKSYSSSHSKYKWACKKGHKFEAPWARVKGTKNHKGTWCNECAKVSRGLKTRLKLTKSDMDKFAKARNLRFLSPAYITTGTKYRWGCRVCDYEWETTHNNISSRGRGCPKCGQKRSNEAKMKTLEEAKAEVKEVGFQLVTQEYSGFNKVHDFKCTVCNTPKRTSFNMLLSQRAICSNCFKTTSYGEFVTKFFVEKLFKKKFEKARPEFLKVGSKGFALELDIYNPELKLAFEVQGLQHYRMSEYFHGDSKGFQQRLKYDRDKKRLCKKHNITLIDVPEVPSMVPVSELKWFLIISLLENNFPIDPSMLNVKIDPKQAFQKHMTNRIDDLKAKVQHHDVTILSKTYHGPKSKIKLLCHCGNTFFRHVTDFL